MKITDVNNGREVAKMLRAFRFCKPYSARMDATQVFSMLTPAERETPWFAAMEKCDRQSYSKHTIGHLIMYAANVLMNGFGVEGFPVDGSYTHGLDYVNMGDPYAGTLIFVDGRIFAGTWGDWVERNESRMSG